MRKSYVRKNDNPDDYSNLVGKVINLLKNTELSASAIAYRFGISKGMVASINTKYKIRPKGWNTRGAF
jgi:hypothetical protein